MTVKPPLIPSFARVEIRIRNKSDIAAAAKELADLATDLRPLGYLSGDEQSAVVLAHHKIRSTSQKLRGTA